MFLYTVLAAILAIAAGILIAKCSKPADGVVYGKLDKAGRITNILLILAYTAMSPFYLFLGMISVPEREGLLGIIGWIIAIIIASASLFCGLGLGFSVALRKKGRSKLSFAIQFAGVLGIGLTFMLFAVFYGNLLSSIN